MYSFEDAKNPDSTAAPDVWIYKHFYNIFHKDRKSSEFMIKQPFDGRTIKVRSLIANDSDPSLCFYYRNGKYFWKDFSGDGKGDAINFVEYHTGKYRGAAIGMIDTHFNIFMEKGIPAWEWEIEKECDVKVADRIITAEPMRMTLEALAWWKSYGINEEMLKNHEVKQIKGYSIVEHGNNPRVAAFNTEFSFAYYSRDKGLYQIYQPFETNFKHMKVRSDYIAGTEQLRYSVPTLIITSGLKDMMALKAVADRLRFDVIAAPSESTIISKKDIQALKARYRHIITIFDNDRIGVKYMNVYRNLYDIPYVNLNLCKDLADNNRKHDYKFLSDYYTKVIDQVIKAKTVRDLNEIFNV